MLDKISLKQDDIKSKLIKEITEYYSKIDKEAFIQDSEDKCINTTFKTYEDNLKEDKLCYYIDNDGNVNIMLEIYMPDGLGSVGEQRELFVIKK